MREWNVVATIREPHFKAGVLLLKQFGDVEKTHFYDVLVARVPDPRQFPEQLAAWLAAHPRDAEILGRVSPCTEAFAFQTSDEFEAKAGEAAARFLPKLAGRRFHVRMHRRGFKGRLHAMDEERILDRFLIGALAEAETPGEITFDDPDAILAVETVDCRAGLALWTREELQRYAFLRFE